MNLVRTSVLSAISTAVKILTGFITNKVISIYLGPSGIALMGHFNNFSSIAVTFSNSINTGAVKYIAEYGGEQEKQKKLLSTAFLIIAACSLLASVIVVSTSRMVSVNIFKSEEYVYIFVIFGISLVIFSLNSFFISVLNGYKEITKYIWINIASSFIGLLITIYLVVHWRLHGALLSFVVVQFAVFFLTVAFILKSDWFRLTNFLDGFDKGSFVKLSKFSLMIVISTFLAPIGQMIVRGHIIDNLSIDAAGYWQGVMRISDGYLSIVTMSLSVYYLPRLSEIKGDKELRKEIFDGYKLILPVVMLSIIIIYLSRDAIIEIFFTEKFRPMRELFAFQLMGDLFKISSWLLGYIIIARAMTRLFIYSEVIFIVSCTILSVLLINIFGLSGAVYAYAVNYLIYLVFVVILFRKIVFLKEQA